MSELPTSKTFDDPRVDVVPVVSARPILTPPKSFNDPVDDPLYAFFNPHSERIELITDLLTIFPHTRQTLYGPVVLSLGPAIFVGRHLWQGYPDALSDRLRLVLTRAYEQDKSMGFVSRWIDVPGVRASWKPAEKPNAMAGLFVESRSKPRTSVRAKTPAPVA